jgi:hypothetical protein
VREEVVRQVLGPLGWDELLAVKAVLADPPPGRDLSPADLVALSRGAPPAPPSLPAPKAKASRKAAARAPRVVPGPRIRRVRDRVEPSAPFPVALPPLDELHRESGRAELERIIRRHGASRPAILAALAARWTVNGAPPGPADLDGLLTHHRLSRGFVEKERALLLHAFRKHGGVFLRVARALGSTPEDVRASLQRLGIEGPVEAIRDARRRVLDRKVTLAERARLIDEEEEALSDLGLLARLEADLKRRMPQHLRALAVGGRTPSAADLGRSLSLSRGAVDRLTARFALPVRPAPPERPDRPGRRDGRRPATGRPAPGRSPAGRPPSSRRPPGAAPARGAPSRGRRPL